MLNVGAMVPERLCKMIAVALAAATLAITFAAMVAPASADAYTRRKACYDGEVVP